MLCVCYLSAWSCGTKGVNLHLGKSYFCHFCYWDVYSIAFFHPYSLSCLFLKRKKKSQNRNILYSMHWYFNQSHFLLFLSLWLVNSEKEVQFECSDDGEDLYRQIFFPPVNRSHLEIKQLHLVLLTFFEELQDLKVQPCEF